MLKKITLSLTLLTILISCNSLKSGRMSHQVNKDTLNTTLENKSNERIEETFILISQEKIDNLNKEIVLKNYKSGEEIMKAYKPESNETEGNETYTLSKNKIDGSTTEVTLIQDGFLDDSVAGEKNVMILKLENGVLKIISIKQNYKCWEGRGHTNWSAEYCH